MATGTIKKPNSTEVIVIQGSLSSTVTIPANSGVRVLQNANIRTALSDLAIGHFPADTNKKLVGADYLWGSDGTGLATDTLVNNGLLTLTVWNRGTGQATVNTIRLLTFWE